MMNFTPIKYIAVLIIAGFTLTNPAKAQETQTLFSPGISHGGYGALIYGFTSINGQPAYLRGGRGAWVINFTDEHALNIGFGSYRTETDFDAVNWTNPNSAKPGMKTNYGGFELEYVNRTHNLFHYSVQTLIGSGKVRYIDPPAELNRTSDSYFVLQPGVNMNLNVTHWFKLSGGVFYRYTGGVNLEGTGSSDLSGVVSFVGLKFGRF
jgi:hypothetical protein